MILWRTPTIVNANGTWPTLANDNVFDVSREKMILQTRELIESFLEALWRDCEKRQITGTQMP